jgi:hypothetical protein
MNETTICCHAMPRVAMVVLLQGAMVDWAAHFHSKLVSNNLKGLPLPSTKVAQNIGLLGHSVGAGLATYVAYRAAQQQPYKAVMYMAPQTQASIWMPNVPQGGTGCREGGKSNPLRSLAGRSAGSVCTTCAHGGHCHNGCPSVVTNVLTVLITDCCTAV